MKDKVSRCIGVYGLLFGHKFFKRNWLDDNNPSKTYPGYCLRCGVCHER